jgi:hypothetical protein
MLRERHQAFPHSAATSATAFLLALSLVAAGATPAAAALARRLTDHTGQACSVAAPAVNGTADGNREIFQVNRTGTINQLTDTQACTNTNPSSGLAGNVVAFDSSCDFGDNADRNVEIFTVANGVITQVTSSANCDNLLPAINSNGTSVSFDSNCDLTGENLDGSVEIFRATIAGAIDQITDDRSASGCASINASTDASGDIIAFESDCDLDAGNGAQVNEIYESRPGMGLVRRTSSQGDACVNATPVLTSDGQALAFASDCDLIGDNPDGGTEIYAIFGDMTEQITNDTGAKGCESASPSIATYAGTDRVVFSSYCNPTGENADGSFEIFSVVDGVTGQITTGQSCWSVTPRMPASGDVVVYVSSCDLDGLGAAGSAEIYVEGVCLCGAPVSAAQPTATDALYALQAGVGAEECPLCECDVNADGRLTATDALRILSKATGQDVTLSCP